MGSTVDTAPRILLIAINHSPELTGIGKYMGEMARWLVERGAAVRVVTAPPYYPDWEVRPGYSAWRYHREMLDGAEVWRCPVWVPKQPGGVKRILHLASFALSSSLPTLWNALAWRPDLVFVVEPPLFCAPVALAAAGLGGARSWLHVQDFEVDAAFELGILRSGRLRVLVERIEAFLMRHFSCVSTISDKMLSRLQGKGVPGDRCRLFPNWVELDRIRPLDTPSPLRAEWGIEDKIVVLYSGNMGEKQGLEILLEAAAGLADRQEVLFLLCGQGAARRRLEGQARGMANLRFMPLQPAERLNDLLNLADIHVLPQRADAADLVLPSKLTNMLASGRPVVATAAQDTQVDRLVSSCGIVVRPGDAQALAGAIEELAQDPGRRQALGAEARRLAEALWDRDAVLEAAFKEMINDFRKVST